MLHPNIEQKLSRTVKELKQLSVLNKRELPNLLISEEFSPSDLKNEDYKKGNDVVVVVSASFVVVALVVVFEVVLDVAFVVTVVFFVVDKVVLVVVALVVAVVVTGC